MRSFHRQDRRNPRVSVLRPLHHQEISGRDDAGGNAARPALVLRDDRIDGRRRADRSARSEEADSGRPGVQRLSSLALGSVDQFVWLFPMAAFAGLMSDIGGPAHAAMVADILPKEQRQDGFGILRVVGNMAWLVGPTVGGIVAKTSFFALFVIDAAISCVVALLFFLLMPETRQRENAEHTENVLRRSGTTPR